LSLIFVLVIPDILLLPFRLLLFGYCENAES